MKKIYMLGSCALLAAGMTAFNTTDSGVVEALKESHRFSSGGQSGLTGAPGEMNCTQCHSGNVMAGSSENILTVLDGTTPVTEYVPGQTYVVSVQLASAPDRSGFSAVALDLTNTNAGSFTGDGALGGTQDFTANSRHYVSHTSASTTGTMFWAWSWTAPATDVGDVNFYVASNVSNNNGSTSGDVIHLSQHLVRPASNGIEEFSNENSFQASYNAAANRVDVNFDYLASGDMFFNLVDMNGRSVYTYKMGQSDIGENSESIVLPSEIENGMYVVHFFVGNKGMSGNILVQK